MTDTIILNDCFIIICHISLHLDSASVSTRDITPAVLSLKAVVCVQCYCTGNVLQS